jgi:hypothetical protein
VHHVIALDMDRLLRDPIDLEDAMSAADRYGVDRHGVTSGTLDFRSSGGQMNARAMAAAKRLQSDDAARGVTRAHLRRTEAGLTEPPARSATTSRARARRTLAPQR